MSRDKPQKKRGAWRLQVLKGGDEKCDYENYARSNQQTGPSGQVPWKERSECRCQEEDKESGKNELTSHREGMVTHDFGLPQFGIVCGLFDCWPVCGHGVPYLIPDIFDDVFKVSGIVSQQTLGVLQKTSSVRRTTLKTTVSLEGHK